MADVKIAQGKAFNIDGRTYVCTRIFKEYADSDDYVIVTFSRIKKEAGE